MNLTPSDAQCRNGFTLIEVVGAAVVLSVALWAVYQISGALGTQLDRSAIGTEIVAHAREPLDSFHAVPFDSVSVGSGGDSVSVRGQTYLRTWTVSQYGPLLKQLSIQVSPSSGQGPSFSVSSYLRGEW